MIGQIEEEYSDYMKKYLLPGRYMYFPAVGHDRPVTHNPFNLKNGCPHYGGSHLSAAIFLFTSCQTTIPNKNVCLQE